MSLFPFLDVTYLESPGTPSELVYLCELIKKAPQPVAGICVYPDKLPFVQQQFARDHAFAWITVLNFPHGDQPLSQVIMDINNALEAGATELDIVLPTTTYLQHQQIGPMAEFMRHCRKEMGAEVKFKIILETGRLTRQDIYLLSIAACEQGVDFIKTSTGKMKPAATLEAAASIQQALYDFYQAHGVKRGLKIAGGIHTPEQAQTYIDQLTTQLPDWLEPSLFRIGASQLLKRLMEQ